MKIVYLKLINFADVYAAMHQTEVEFDFKDVKKPIIQIYGKNRSGKTVLIQKLHPFSSINLNGDDRNDVPLIINGECGVKQIVYEMDGNVYQLTHTYKPNAHGHVVSSSFIKNGEELNASGGVNTFNNLVDREFGINRYVFQFIINGTQLTSFAGLNQTQRKTLLNKAMGIDIYDRIHKLSTEDYRYTSKLITSLNNTREYLLQNYGSYENLKTVLDQTETQYTGLTKHMQNIKSQMDKYSGVIVSLQSQNVEQSLYEIEQRLMKYENVVSTLGTFDVNCYDRLVDEQIELNQQMNALNTKRMLLLKDIDGLYEKRNIVNDEIMENQRNLEEYNNLVQLKNDLTIKIESIVIPYNVNSSSNALLSTIPLVQAVNDSAREIVLCLNDHHLEMFCDMILNHVDIEAFLLKEGTVLMDSEKEKNAIARMKIMLSTVNGEEIHCGYTDQCLYKNTYERIAQYFKSYEEVHDGSFTQYDLEQFDHSVKNYKTICRLIHSQIPNELEYDFSINSIITNIKSRKEAIDVERVKALATISANIELRKQYIHQVSEIDQQLKHMKHTSNGENTGTSNETLQSINVHIGNIQKEVDTLTTDIDRLRDGINDNEQKRLQLSSIKNMDIKDIKKRHKQLTSQVDQLHATKQQLNELNAEYHTISNQVLTVEQSLNVLRDANQQYLKTMEEIAKHTIMDKQFKIISEATSSTKGKPVVAIKDMMNRALQMANRLLNVMYDGDIELLPPKVDETMFTLPFRCGINTSEDIKTGSQSESTLLSLALSMSLASMLTHYNVFLLDECDGYLDMSMRDAFVTMLQDIMSTLKMEQMFIISHSIQPNQYEYIVHTIDISHD